MFDKNIPILNNPEFDVANLEISSVDYNHKGNIINIVYDLQGFQIDSLIEFHTKKEIDIIIDNVCFYDQGRVDVDPRYFDDIIPNMYKLFIDEYVFNNVVIQVINPHAKLAILLYKDIRFLCTIKNNLKINMAFDLKTGAKIPEEIYIKYRRELDDVICEYINSNQMNRAQNMDVVITRMYEQAVDNTQYFVRIVRKDYLAACPLGSSNTLEYACFQTKHHDRAECLSRAWMMASYAAQFVGLTSMKDVILKNFPDDEAVEIRSDDNFIAILGV